MSVHPKRVPVVYAAWGRFRLSRLAVAKWRLATGNACLDDGADIARTDATLVSIVQELKQDANGPGARLTVLKLEAGTRYAIHLSDDGEEILWEDDIEWHTA